MQQRSRSVTCSRWCGSIGGAGRAGLLALLLTSVTGFAPPRSPVKVEIGSYSASRFKFTTVQEDDPSLPAGGWQVANATLNFVDGRQRPRAAWSCAINVGMPLRTVKRGRISPEWAAKSSARVATEASANTMHSKSRWAPVPFCRAFKDEMNRLFGEKYQGLGARVVNQS